MGHAGAVTVLVWLDDDAAVDPQLTGAKFSTLARVGRWPMPDRPEIPRAAAASTHAWHLVVEHNELDALVRRARAGDEDAAESLAAALATARLPDQLHSHLTEAATVLLEQGPGEIAVRSSAVAEDQDGRTFAGQYVTRLSVRDVDTAVQAYRDCLASAWLPGARRYRARTAVADAGVDDPAMAVVLQAMAHHGEGWAGAALSDGAGGVTVEVVRGLGDALMAGRADPLRWTVAGDEQPDGRMASAVVGWVRRAEQRVGHGVEVEFAVRPDTPAPVVLQLRAHTAGARFGRAGQRRSVPSGVVNGLAIGSGTARGPVCCLEGPDQHDRLVAGGVLVTSSTDPAWLPLLGSVAAVVTDHGGLTSHAAIVCRELGLLAVVGCGDATRRLVHGDEVEVRCDGPAGSVSSLS